MGTSKILIDGVGIDLTADTVAANKMLSGIMAHDSNGDSVTGNIESKAAETFTPTTADQTIAAGKYLSGAQTVKGDANLVAGNIKQGVSIFGVAGNLTPGITPSGTKNITANGTYDVTEFAVADVNVPAPTVNSKTFSITLVSDMEVSSRVTVVSGDSDLAAHYDDSSLVVSFLTSDASGSNFFINGIMSNLSNSKNATGGYGARYSTSIGGVSLYAPNVSTGQGIKITANGDMIFVSHSTYKFNAGTYEVIVVW